MGADGRTLLRPPYCGRRAADRFVPTQSVGTSSDDEDDDEHDEEEERRPKTARFLQPSLLFFLLLAALPVILYLLFRLRRHEVDWGATYVLRLTLRSGRRRGRWQQVVVLALRTLLLAGLVAAFARPFTHRRDGKAEEFLHPAGTLHRVVLVDNSRSMLASYGATNRLDAAREIVAELLVATRPGDTCHVIPLCPDGKGDRSLFPERPSAPARRAPAAEKTPVPFSPVPCPVGWRRARQAAAAIEPAAAGADLALALPAAVQAFRDSAAAARQLVILSDLARVDHPAIGDYEIFGAMLKGLSVQVATLSFGSREVGNVALESLSAGSDVLLADQPTNVYLEVMNYSEGSSGDRLLQFLVDGEVAKEETVALSAGQRKTVPYVVTLSPGEHSLECRLAPDAYAADNRIQRYVRVRKSLSVLVVAPKAELQDPFKREDEFLRRQLSARAPFELRLEPLTDRTLLPQSFEARDVVFLCGLARLQRATREALERFVRRGGGLVLSVAPGLDPADFNRTYEELLPARLAEPFRTAFDEERYLSVQPSDLPILLLREFERDLNGDLSAGRVYNHFRLENTGTFNFSSDFTEALPAHEGGAQAHAHPTRGIGKSRMSPYSRTLLTLSNGDPLLVERRFGKGCVLLWSTTQGAAWNSLVVHQAHLPLVYRLLHYAASFREPPASVQPGDTLIREVPAGAEPFMTTPDMKLVACPVVASGGKSFVRFEQTSAPGAYSLRDASGASLGSFSVALPPAESDLRVLRDDEARRFEAVLHTRICGDAPELREALARAGGGTEHAGWLLMAALALLLLDGVLTRVWFR